MQRWPLVLLLLSACSDRQPPREAPPREPPRAPDPEPRPPKPPEAPQQVASRRTSWFLRALSDDGKRALLSEVASSPRALRFRVIDVNTNTVEADLDLPVLSTMPLETLTDDGESTGAKVDLDKAGLAEELRQARTVLAQFPLGAGGRLAATPDGTHVVFNGGDQLYVASEGDRPRSLGQAASYHPLFVAGGKTLVFHRHNGTYDGVVGKYELFATTPGGTTKPARIPSTLMVREGAAVTPTGAVRVIAGYPPNLALCVFELAPDLSPTRPVAATKRGCLPGGEQVSTCVLSPAGRWLACNTSIELAELDPNSKTIINGREVPNKKRAYRIRTLDVDTGKSAVLGDDEPIGMPAAISDEGLVVVGVRDGARTYAADGTSRTIATRIGIGRSSRFRSPTELVTVDGDDVIVIDVAQ